MVVEVVTLGAAILKGFLNWGAAGRARREARRLGRDAIARGEEEVRRYNLELKQLLGQQRTAVTAQNVDADYGDADRMKKETVAFGLEDEATIRLNAAREARGYRSAGNEQSRALQTQAVFDVAGGAIDAWSIYNRNKGVGGGKERTRATAPASVNMRVPFRTPVGPSRPRPLGLSR